MVHICKTRTSARMLTGSILDLFGTLLVLVDRVSFPNDLGVSHSSHRLPQLPQPGICQIYSHNIGRVTYLEQHSYANEDIGLLECSETPPSRPKTSSLRRFSNRYSVSFQQFPLLSADTQQLYLIGLEQGNTKREVDAHYPELSRAQKMPIGCIRQHDLDQIHMKETRCCNSQRNIPHLQVRMISIGNEPCDSQVQDDGP